MRDVSVSRKRHTLTCGLLFILTVFNHILAGNTTSESELYWIYAWVTSIIHGCVCITEHEILQSIHNIYTPSTFEGILKLGSSLPRKSYVVYIANTPFSKYPFACMHVVSCL